MRLFLVTQHALVQTSNLHLCSWLGLVSLVAIALYMFEQIGFDSRPLGTGLTHKTDVCTVHFDVAFVSVADIIPARFV